MEARKLEEKESLNIQVKKMKISSYKIRVQYARIHLSPRHNFGLNYSFGKDD